MNGQVETVSRAHQPLPPNQTIGGMKIVSSTPDLLVLKGASGYSIKFIVLGVLITLFGAMAWASFLLGLKERTTNIKVLALPLVGVGMIAMGIGQLNRKWAFDGKQKAMFSGKMTGGTLVRPRDSFTHVEVLVLPTNLDQRETLRVVLKLRQGETWLLLGSLRTKKREAVVLAGTAGEVSRLLDLPVVVHGAPAEGEAPLRSYLENLRVRPQAKAA